MADSAPPQKAAKMSPAPSQSASASLLEGQDRFFIIVFTIDQENHEYAFDRIELTRESFDKLSRFFVDNNAGNEIFLPLDKPLEYFQKDEELSWEPGKFAELVQLLVAARVVYWDGQESLGQESLKIAEPITAKFTGGVALNTVLRPYHHY